MSTLGWLSTRLRFTVTLQLERPLASPSSGDAYGNVGGDVTGAAFAAAEQDVYTQAVGVLPSIVCFASVLCLE